MLPLELLLFDIKILKTKLQGTGQVVIKTSDTELNKPGFDLGKLWKVRF